MNEAAYPTWPAGPSWPTRERATVAAVFESEVGDIVVVHRGVCAVRFDLDCDCGPDVVIVGDARA